MHQEVRTYADTFKLWCLHLLKFSMVLMMWPSFVQIFLCIARGLNTVHQTCADKFSLLYDYISREPRRQTLKKPSKAEPSVLSYGKVIYDGVICNTFKACITLLFISWQVSAELSVTCLNRKKLTHELNAIFERCADISKFDSIFILTQITQVTGRNISEDPFEKPNMPEIVTVMRFPEV